MTATFDESVVSRPVRFDLGQADFYTAMAVACQMTHTFWTPLDDKQILLAGDTAQNHRQFDRMALRTFYLPGVTSPQELTDVVNLLRNLFEIRLVTPAAAGQHDRGAGSAQSSGCRHAASAKGSGIRVRKSCWT